MAPGSPDMHQPNWKIVQIHTNSLFFSFSILKELQKNLPDSVGQTKNNGLKNLKLDATTKNRLHFWNHVRWLRKKNQLKIDIYNYLPKQYLRFIRWPLLFEL